jgi:hypothetical protein
LFNFDDVTYSDQELAAALLVAVQSRLLSPAAVIQVVDREIVARDEANAWLIEASLAREHEDMLSALRCVAGTHPMCSDLHAVLEAADLALALGCLDEMEAASRVLHAAYRSYGDWEKDLRNPLYNLDEELTCAHDYDGVPNRSRVAEALSKVLEVSRERERWSGVWGRILL